MAPNILAGEEAPVAVVTSKLLLIGALDGAAARVDLDVEQDLLLAGERLETELALQAPLFCRVQRPVLLVTEQRRVLLPAFRLVTDVMLFARIVNLESQKRN